MGVAQARARTTRGRTETSRSRLRFSADALHRPGSGSVTRCFACICQTRPLFSDHPLLLLACVSLPPTCFCPVRCPLLRGFGHSLPPRRIPPVGAFLRLRLPSPAPPIRRRTPSVRLSSSHRASVSPSIARRPVYYVLIVYMQRAPVRRLARGDGLSKTGCCKTRGAGGVHSTLPWRCTAQEPLQQCRRLAASTRMRRSLLKGSAGAQNALCGAMPPPIGRAGSP